MEVERKWESIKGINISARGSGSMHGSMREKCKRGVVVMLVVVEHGKPRRIFWGKGVKGNKRTRNGGTNTEGVGREKTRQQKDKEEEEERKEKRKRMASVGRWKATRKCLDELDTTDGKKYAMYNSERKPGMLIESEFQSI